MFITVRQSEFGAQAFETDADGFFGNPIATDKDKPCLDDLVMSIDPATIIVVEDCMFQSGVYKVVRYHGANGVGAGYKLERILTLEECAALHGSCLVEAARRVKLLKLPKGGEEMERFVLVLWNDHVNYTMVNDNSMDGGWSKEEAQKEAEYWRRGGFGVVLQLMS